MIIDVIGDIHGQAGKLAGLLEALGYEHDGRAFMPPANHRALFIGDLIDRGAQQVATLNIVFDMIDAGVADAVMGNHEYNALAYATPDPENDGAYLRQHTKAHNRQHEAFLDELAFGSPDHTFWLGRLYELPLWLETASACFVHACWDVDSMAVLAPILGADHTLTPRALALTSKKDSRYFEALERVLKGVEVPLPDNLTITDKEGTKRDKIRVRWWLPDLHNRTISEVARAPKSSLNQIPDHAKNSVAQHIDFVLKTDKPVFVGHYWLDDDPAPLSDQVVCTDYSAAIDSGYLTAYQLDTDNPLPLAAKNFVQYDHNNAALLYRGD